MNLIPDDIDWAAYEHETEATAKVRPAGDFLTAMIADIGQPRAVEPCAYLPWEKTHRHFALRQGETTLWGGANGNGKSAVTGLVATSLIAQSESVCIASFEMKPRMTLRRMVRQFMGVSDEPTDPREIAVIRDIYEQFRALCERKLWLFDQQGTVTPERAIAVTRYCFKELGIRHMIIDSLMKCVRGEDDYCAQKDIVDELTALARDYGAHGRRAMRPRSIRSRTIAQ